MVDSKIALGPQWGEILQSIWTSDEFKKLGGNLAKARAKKVLYPERKNVFRAFRETPFDEVKVVWLGMDPYPNQNATGLSFECGVNLTPSFTKILGQYEIENPGHFNTNMMSGKIAHWAEQGVFLMNAALTVPHGQSGKHLKHWQFFTQDVLKRLDERKNPPVFVLLGKNAEDFAEGIVEKAVILKYEHPAYAARNNRPWIADKIFATINAYLDKPIEW